MYMTIGTFDDSVLIGTRAVTINGFEYVIPIYGDKQ